MKSFQEFMSESFNISGNVSTIIINNGGDLNPKNVGEQFVADIVYRGNIHRLSVVSENGILTRNQLTEQIQDEYPGAIVHNIYVENSSNKLIKITDDKRYHPSKLEWQ